MGLHVFGLEADVAVADANLADPVDIRRLFARAKEAFGTVDILVNNAAIAPGEQDNLETMWDAVLSLNLKAAKLMSDASIRSAPYRSGSQGRRQRRVHGFTDEVLVKRQRP